MLDEQRQELAALMTRRRQLVDMRVAESNHLEQAGKRAVRSIKSVLKTLDKQLAAIVTVAMETGLRRGELLDLTWDRVDMTRGVLRLEVTKSGKRREVPSSVDARCKGSATE